MYVPYEYVQMSIYRARGPALRCRYFQDSRRSGVGVGFDFDLQDLRNNGDGNHNRRSADIKQCSKRVAIAAMNGHHFTTMTTEARGVGRASSHKIAIDELEATLDTQPRVGG